MYHTQYIDCECSLPGHAIRVVVDDEDMWLETHLRLWYPWYKRIWIAMLYVIGRTVPYGHYDTTVLGPKQRADLLSVLTRISTQ